MEPDRFLTRRQFLRSVTVAAAGAPYILTSSALGATNRPAASDRIAIASIGIRNMGGNHLKTLLGRGDVQVVAICDVDKQIRDRGLVRVHEAYSKRYGRGSYKATTGYNDFRELMARDDIDAVVVATPDHTHATISIAALKSGKDVYVEKPMTLTIKEGRAMVKAARRYDRILQAGSQRRSSAKIRRACELVRNGRIGRLLTVEAHLPQRPRSPQPWAPEPVPPGFDYDKWLGPAPRVPYTTKRCHYNFRFIRDYSGGEMTNFGAHHFDVAQWGIGADDCGPVEVEGKGEFYESGLFDTFHRVHVIYTYANGVKLICRTGDGGTRFIGTEGWIDADRFDAHPRAILKSKIGPNEIHLYESRGGHMGNFLECTRTRKDPSAPVEVGHRSATVCHVGNIAMLLGRKLKWDSAKEEFTGDDEANRMTWRPYRSPWRL